MSLDYRAFYNDVVDWIYQSQEVERLKGGNEQAESPE